MKSNFSSEFSQPEVALQSSEIMSRDKLSILPLVVIALILAASSTSCKANNQNQCNTSSCGNIRNISYPFRLKEDPAHCGDPGYELVCENDRAILYSNFTKYYVQEIYYDKKWIRVVDPGLDKANCSSFPINILKPFDLVPVYSFEVEYPSFYYLSTPVLFISCAAPAKSSIYYSITKLCGNRTPSQFLTSTQNYSYILVGNDSTTVADVEDNCTVNAVAWVSKEHNTSHPDLYVSLAYGFLLDWSYLYCRECRSDFCDAYVDNNNVTHVTCSVQHSCSKDHPSTFRPTFKCLKEIWKQLWDELWHGQVDFLGVYWVNYRKKGIIIGLGLAGRCILGIPFLLALIIYKKRRSHLSMYENIEEFLQGPNNLMPVRYAYSDIKKITNNFSSKLGEGGFGTVFKGKLRSGSLVAVKMLGKSKASGQEFISEVATIGRIHHANVVKLIGFCFEGSKRALVYECMPNGSLEKYIFQKETEAMSLSCEKLFEIALGVARGIDYLHRGCEMQILHFDIKPHNILLDEHFTPKISDFGLAKLYPTENSIVPLTAARGTLGYMAPELYYKNIGGVSYKADIYSFGMLLLEMAGKRKNFNTHVDQLSQIYFPSWVYDQFSKGKNIEMGDASDDERKMVKKMILVALWCIQMKPTNRPSMNKIIEMLEGDGDLIEMPPKPFQSPEEIPAANNEADAGTDDVPLLSACPLDSSDMNIGR